MKTQVPSSRTLNQRESGAVFNSPGIDKRHLNTPAEILVDRDAVQRYSVAGYP
jgi:hypothetical protein